MPGCRCGDVNAQRLQCLHSKHTLVHFGWNSLQPFRHRAEEVTRSAHRTVRQHRHGGLSFQPVPHAALPGTQALWLQAVHVHSPKSVDIPQGESNHVCLNGPWKDDRITRYSVHVNKFLYICYVCQSQVSVSALLICQYLINVLLKIIDKTEWQNTNLCISDHPGLGF